MRHSVKLDCVLQPPQIFRDTHFSFSVFKLNLVSSLTCDMFCSHYFQHRPASVVNRRWHLTWICDLRQIICSLQWGRDIFIITVFLHGCGRTWWLLYNLGGWVWLEPSEPLPTNWDQLTGTLHVVDAHVVGSTEKHESALITQTSCDPIYSACG